MFHPDDPLKPIEPNFEEAWQAQALAIADAMVQAGHFSASEWADALGAELANVAKQNKPDTLETYYHAALRALEKLAAHVGISQADQQIRKYDWQSAYENTPHGAPVQLYVASSHSD